MFPAFTRLSKALSYRSHFQCDETGTIALLFALSILPVFIAVGLAIDGSRAYSTRARVSAVLDAAALATAKSMRDRDLSDAEVNIIAARYVTEHMKRVTGSGITNEPVVVNIDRIRASIRLELTAHIVNFIGPIINVPRFDIVQSATAMYGTKNVEVGMMLDVSGSMADAGKINDLKSAVTALLDIMIPGTGANDRVKIGIAPFSTSVNAGAYASLVKTGDPKITCVSERTGTTAFTDDAPISGDQLGHKATRCPENEILALTSSRLDLVSNVNALTPNGSTAGHLGIAWAWYLISPSWQKIWPSASQPKAYADPRLIKSIILMTDGMFNVEYERTQNGSSAEQALTLCNNVKAQNVIVYTIGFQAPTDALALLRSCATSPSYFFDAQDGSALREAFTKIAADLTELRLSQ